MKLIELTERDNIQHVKSNKRPNLKNLEKIGSGSEAVVYRAKNNSVLKVLNIKNTEDGTYQYIDMVMDNQDNLFFPKIYSAKSYESPAYSGGMTLYINMEKLVPFKSAKATHLFPILIKQMGLSDELNAELNLDYNTDDITDQDYKKVEHIGFRIQRMFNEKEGREKLIKHSTNPQLKDAFKKTSDIISSSSRLSGDLHDENFMLRLTGVGPQLVIVDPILS